MQTAEGGAKSADFTHKDKALYPSPILIGYSAAVCLLWNCPRSTLLAKKQILFLRIDYHFCEVLSRAFGVLLSLELRHGTIPCLILIS